MNSDGGRDVSFPGHELFWSYTSPPLYSRHWLINQIATQNEGRFWLWNVRQQLHYPQVQPMKLWEFPAAPQIKRPPAPPSFSPFSPPISHPRLTDTCLSRVIECISTSILLLGKHSLDHWFSTAGVFQDSHLFCCNESVTQHHSTKLKMLIYFLFCRVNQWPKLLN